MNMNKSVLMYVAAGVVALVILVGAVVTFTGNGQVFENPLTVETPSSN